MLQRCITGRAGAPCARQRPLQASCPGDTGAPEEGHRASERTACVPAGGQGWQGATQGQHPGQAAPQQQQAASPRENVRVGTQNPGACCPELGARPCTEALGLQIKAGSLRRKASAASAALAPVGDAVPDSLSSLLPGQTAARSELLWMPDPCHEEGVMSEAACELEGKHIWID